MKLFIITFIIFLQQMNISARSTSVDVALDMQYSWKIRGNYLYSPKGAQLSEFPNKFPSGFDFKSISQANGIWCVFPSIDPVTTEHNETVWTNEVEISFASSAQLMKSLTIWHNSGGHAIINVIVNGHNFTQTPEAMFSGWTSVGIELEGTSRFTVQAITTKPGDYILIDKIEAVFLDTTTTHRPRPSTTRKPPRSSAPSVHGSLLLNAGLIFMSLLIIMAHRMK